MTTNTPIDTSAIDKNVFITGIFTVVARAVLLLIAGSLQTLNKLTPEQAQSIVQEYTPHLIAALTVAWSIWEKYRSANKLAIANQSPAQTVAVTNKKAAS